MQQCTSYVIYSIRAHPLLSSEVRKVGRFLEQSRHTSRQRAQPKKKIKAIMERVCVFTNLPGELLSLLVSDWLDWKDVGHFDSAVCNGTSRTEWLNLLNNHCVFRAISRDVGSFQPFVRWCLSRCVRVRDVYVKISPQLNEITATQWFKHTGPFLTSLAFPEIGPIVKEAVARYCSRLQVFSVDYGSEDDEGYGDILRNKPNLQQLRISGYINPIPTGLKLSSLQRLELAHNVYDSADIAVLLQQVPSLRSIKIDESSFCAAFEPLATISLPNLVHLHLECDYDSDSDSHLCTLEQAMKNLQKGLRCLVLSVNGCFEYTELGSIAQYHGHSLRCLSIEDDVDWTDFTEQLNQMPHLHTLSMTYQSLSTLPSLIANPSITHLYMDLPSSRFKISETLSTHCPGLTTLSLFWHSPSPNTAKALDLHPTLFNARYAKALVNIAVSDITRLLELRPLISTLCVNNDDVLLGLRTNFPHINVVKYVAIDIFCTDY